MSFAACIVARDAEETISSTLDSILYQSVSPEVVCVLDDGSTDDTPRILRQYRVTHANSVHVLRKENRVYDIRRVPHNLNQAYRYVISLAPRIRYWMISGDDCNYPKNYVETLLEHMEHDCATVVASGVWLNQSNPIDDSIMPTGSGRMIQVEFWRKIGAAFPERYGWEGWLLFKAMSLGYSVRALTSLNYTHLRAQGSKHKFIHWGVAMKVLGYHPVFVLGRILRNLIFRPRSASKIGLMHMLLGYLTAYRFKSDGFYREFDKAFKDYVRKFQVQRMRTILRNFTRKILS